MTRTTLNRRLTTTDAGFLYFERPGLPLHIGSCNLYDGHVSLEELRQIVLDRLHLLPRYRQRVHFPPFGIAHPTWEDDPEFDIRHHVEEIALPSPGDDHVMSLAGGKVFARMLDRRRPLWKLVLLQGRADGNTAMLAMIHHAMVDGISGVELQTVLHDLTPKAEPSAVPPASWQPAPPPDELTLLQDSVRDRLKELAELWTDETFRSLRPRDLGQRARKMQNALTSSLPAVIQPAPSTPFNAPVSSERQFVWTELSFAEVRGIRAVLGGTVNDVVLTVLSGALGRYLEAHGRRLTPGLELRAMCPVSVRGQDERGALGNLVSMMIAPLYAGIEDPVERLSAERTAMERLKAVDQAGGLHAFTALADLVPPAWQALAGQVEVPNTLLNTVSTNVPGPQIPLYLAGRLLRSWYPLGPLSAGIGLFVAILSYNQKLTFGATVDPKLVPDAWFFAGCLEESFAELRAAAERAAGTAQEPPPSAPSDTAARTDAVNGHRNGAARRGESAERVVSPRGR